MNVISVVKNVGARVAVKLADNAPTILVVTGTAAMALGAVLAVKQTAGADDILDDHKERMKAIVERRKRAEEKKEYYPVETQRLDTVKEFFKTGGKFVKLYSPAIIAEIVGATMIFTGHHILAQRHLAAVASYAAAQKSYDDYRERIIEEYGEEADAKALTGMHKESVTTMDENGGETVTDYDNAIDPESVDQFSVLYDDMYSTSWTPNAVTNMAQIKAVEEYYNNIFEARKFIRYEDVLRDLGIWDRLPIEKQKIFVGKGWVWGCGDNHISLGIFDVNKPMTDARKEFIMGYEPSILIVPNLDGDIASLL